MNDLRTPGLGGDTGTGLDVRALIIDLDGTIYRGSELIPGARAALQELRGEGLRVRFFTNSSTASRREYVDRLSRFEIEADGREILTAVDLTARFVVEHHPDAEVFVIGEKPAKQALQRRNISFAETPGDTDVVVVGLDRNMTYDTLITARLAVNAAEHYIATNPDMTRPSEETIVPSTGTLIAAIEAMTDRTPDVIVGKPSTNAGTAALESVELAPSQCLVIGDRLDTDIRMGNRMGCTTVLVLSGVTDRSMLDASDVRPTHVIDSISTLPELIECR